MTGGLLQLVARGINDIYLIGDPQITIFKIVYRRHINFSIYDDIIVPHHRADFSSSSHIPLDRRGDLLTNLHLLIDIPEIYIKKHLGTFEYIKQVLTSYGINWDYSDDDNDIVTFDDYNAEIIGIKDTINNKIINNINMYNFFNNAYILSTAPKVTINMLSDVLDRLLDSSDTDHDATISLLKEILINGRTIGIVIFSKMLTSYATSYASDSDTSLLPLNNVYYVATDSSASTYKNILMFEEKFKNDIFKYGILLRALEKYTADASVYNTSDDFAVNSIDGSISYPLFDEILSRGSSPKKELIPFLLYTADDIRFLTYITLLNNLTRIKILSSGSEDFNPTNSTIINGIDISLSESNILLLEPNNISFYESILFYHIFDPDVNIFPVYQYDIGLDTKTYFNNKIGNVYDILDKYSDLISITREEYSLTDAYKIYKLFIQNINNDTLNNKIKSSQQVDLIVTTIKYSIENNIKYNLDTLSNILIVLYKSFRTELDHYIISFYKSYSGSSDTFTALGTSFNPIIGNSSLKLSDNFKNVIENIITLFAPTGITVKKYFNEYTQSQIKEFVIECQNQLRFNNFDKYINDYTLWKRISNAELYDSTYATAISGSGKPTLDSSVFEKISLMNHIPLLAAKDIPKMIFDMFSDHAKSIFVDMGADTTSDYTNYTAFLVKIDFRDSDDDTTVYTEPTNSITKTAIYNKIYDNVATANITGIGLDIVDKTYFQEMKNIYTGSTKNILCCSLRPESFLSKYSTQDTSSGNIVDFSSDEKDLVYLPIEWLTQTYYQILKPIIENFVDGLSIPGNDKTSGKENLIGLLENIINCFILNGDIPSYDDYKNNNFVLLGLTTESNSTFKKYKTTAFTTSYSTPKYSDAISTIWYQTQKKFIQLYNKLFNDTLLSNNYYNDQLGSIMGTMFSYIKTKLVDDPSDTLNPYFNRNNLSSDPQYIDRIPETLKNSLGEDATEIYPPIDTASGDFGFDFYRLKNTGDYLTDGTIANIISTFVTDSIKMWTFITNYYNKYKNVLKFRDDDDSILYTEGLETKIRRKKTYIYDRSYNINNYFNEHIKLKYVTNNSDLDTATKTILNTLLDNTSAYWNPDKNDEFGEYVRNITGVYGILDSLYNSDLTGNIISTIEKLSEIPSGKTHDNYIDYNENPFNTYFLRDWYLLLSATTDLVPLNKITYRNLSSVVDVFKSLIFEEDGTTQKITSQTIFRNSGTQKLFSNTGSTFHNFTFIVWLIIESLLSSLERETNIPFSELTYIIVNNLSTESFSTGAGTTESTNTIKKLNKIFDTKLNLYLNNFLKISEFKSTTNTDNINDFNVFFDISSPDNNDIILYEETSGDYKVNITLEKRLIDILNNLPPKFAWVKELGYKLIKKISINIGGQQIEVHTPELLHFIHELFRSNEHERGHNILIGNTEEMYTLSSYQRSIKKLIIPLEFGFCRHAGNALPLLNLLYSGVDLYVDINNLNEVLYIDSDSYFTKQPKLQCSLMAQYVYLDEDERFRMAKSKLEYLIERFNYNGETVYSGKTLLSSSGVDADDIIDVKDISVPVEIKIKVNDPIKYFIWYIKFKDSATEQQIDKINWNLFGYNVRNENGDIVSISKIISSISIKMNGVQREQSRDENFYTHVIPYSRKIPSLNKGEYMYCFAVYPTLLQPSGTANYSEIQDSSIVIEFTDTIKRLLLDNKNLIAISELWGCTYNILRVLSGMAGLAFFK